MRVNTLSLARFIGGQAEVQALEVGLLVRGEIKTIEVVGSELRVKFAWCARYTADKGKSARWVKDDMPGFEFSLAISTITDVGGSGGQVGGDSRICITSIMLGETIVLYPPNGSKLDRSKVDGL